MGNKKLVAGRASGYIQYYHIVSNLTSCLYGETDRETNRKRIFDDKSSTAKLSEKKKNRRYLGARWNTELIAVLIDCIMHYCYY